MYIRFLLITLLSLCSLSIISHNQRAGLNISGHLIDEDSKEPMAQATIQLFWANDSSFVGGTISNERGNFSVEAPSNGTFRLKISSVGYLTVERDITLRKNQNLELGNIHVSPESVMLKEAVVTARVAQVVVRKDTILYSPDACRTRH